MNNRDRYGFALVARAEIEMAHQLLTSAARNLAALEVAPLAMTQDLAAAQTTVTRLTFTIDSLIKRIPG